jgi:hypothetical protein
MNKIITIAAISCLVTACGDPEAERFSQDWKAATVEARYDIAKARFKQTYINNKSRREIEDFLGPPTGIHDDTYRYDMVQATLCIYFCQNGLAGETVYDYPEVELGVERVENLPLHETAPDEQRDYRFDPAKPFRLVVRIGSVLSGWHVVALDQSGAVDLHRVRGRRDVYERAELKLPPEDMAEIARLAMGDEMLRLHRGYAADVHDGTDCVFIISQGDTRKAVGCHNHFPKTLQTFVNQIYRIMDKNGYEQLTWALETRTQDQWNPHMK